MGNVNFCFSLPWEEVVTAWQPGCESLPTGRLVPQLVDAEENRTSCQASGWRPTFALRSAVAIQSLRIHIKVLYTEYGHLPPLGHSLSLVYTSIVKFLAIDLGG